MWGRFWSSVYLVVLVWPIPEFLAAGPSAAEAVLVACGIVGFVALYLRVTWTALCAAGMNATPYSLAMLFVVTAALVPLLGELWLFASLFFVIAAVGASQTRRTLVILGALIVLGVIVTLWARGTLMNNWWIVVQAGLFGGAIDSFVRLHEAKAQVERLAAENERLRVARDMHDLLGQSLSVMTLKSQLAGRLLVNDVDRARAEIGEVEELSRRTLDEVRDTLSGYRTLSLSEELDNARRTLAAAGVRVQVHSGPVPPPAESLLAWVVREATTNVVRHSQAAQCVIRLGTDGRQAFIEVADDGKGPGQGSGTGLRGLAERLEAVGGTVSGDRGPDGGFLLAARVPA